MVVVLVVLVVLVVVLVSSLEVYVVRDLSLFGDLQWHKKLLWSFVRCHEAFRDEKNNRAWGVCFDIRKLTTKNTCSQLLNASSLAPMSLCARRTS